MSKKLLNAGSSGQGWHFSETQLTCPQRHAYHAHLSDHPDVIKAMAVNKDPLVKGSLVHVGLAHYYLHMQGRQQGWDTSEWHTPTGAIEALADIEGEDWQRWTSLASSTVDAYARHRAHETPNIIAVEYRTEVPITGTSFLGTEVSTAHSARVDLIVRGADGKYWWWDHKSGYVCDARKKRGFQLSGQLLGHHYLGRKSYGDAWGGVAINTLLLRPASPRFPRYAPAPAPFAVATFEQQIIDRRALIDALDASGRDPWLYPRALSEQGPCEDRYGPCPFRDLCRWGPTTRW